MGNSLSSPNPKNLLISGNPGVGKTTLIKEVILPYRDQVGGFYTDELREGRIRKGFMIHTFDGQSRVLASKEMKSPHKMHKYGIDMNALENVGVPALRLALMTKAIVVVDEIGTMEVISQKFREILMQCLVSPKRVLATIRQGSKPFTDEVKRLPNTQFLTLTRATYPALKAQVRKWLES